MKSEIRVLLEEVVVGGIGGSVRIYLALPAATLLGHRVPFPFHHESCPYGLQNKET